MSRPASTRMDMDRSTTPSTKRPKISTDTDSAPADAEQEKKRVLLVPVLAEGKSRNFRKFAFPMEFVYDNLAALLGLKKNPWGDLVSSEQDEEGVAPLPGATPTPPPAAATAASQENNATEADDGVVVSPSPSAATIVTLKSETLCELGVTDELCHAYVNYCRTRECFSAAYAFLLKAAGPDHLLKQIEKSRLKEIIRNKVSKFGSEYSWSEKRDYLHYYHEWKTFASDSRRDKHFSENIVVQLYTDDGDIDELRSRIRTMLWNLDDVVAAVSRGMRDDVVEIMRGCYLPFYHVPLLGENEADDGSNPSNIV